MTMIKKLLFVVGALVLAAVLYVAVWPFVIGGSNMRAFCQSLKKDTLLTQVRGIAEQNRYRMTSPDKEGRAFIHESRSFGRFICEVQFKEERLVAARYQQND